MILDKKGPSIPQAHPNMGPQISPHRRTGICIGERRLPALGMAWSARGRTTQRAMQAAVVIIFLVCDIVDLSNRKAVTPICKRE